MVQDISLTRASFVSLWLETLFYGAYAVLYSICMYILLFRRRPNGGASINKPMVFTATAMFVLSSIHIFIGLVRGLKAFIDAAYNNGALEYYAEIWNALSIFKQALYATNNILADGLVVYRCYVVWGRDYKVVVVPIIMLISTTVCAYLAVYNFSQVHPGDNVFASNIAEWGTALFSLSLATNVIVTTLIASRIWWLSRAVKQHLSKRHSVKYNHAMAIIIESGAIYSLCTLTLLVLYCSESNAQYIVYDALAQIMGMVPTLIIVRIGLGISTEDITSTYFTESRGPNGTINLPPIVFHREVTTHMSTDSTMNTHTAHSKYDDVFSRDRRVTDDDGTKPV